MAGDERYGGRLMPRRDVRIPAPDGHSHGTLHVPDGDGPWPATASRCPTNPTYDAAAEARHWEALERLYRDHLGA